MSSMPGNRLCCGSKHSWDVFALRNVGCKCSKQPRVALFPHRRVDNEQLTVRGALTIPGLGWWRRRLPAGPLSCPSPPAWREMRKEKKKRHVHRTSKYNMCLFFLQFWLLQFSLQLKVGAKSTSPDWGRDCVAELYISSITSFRTSPTGVCAEGVAAHQSSPILGSEIYFVFQVVWVRSRHSVGTVTMISPRPSSWYCCEKAVWLAKIRWLRLIESHLEKRQRQRRLRISYTT